MFSVSLPVIVTALAFLALAIIIGLSLTPLVIILFSKPLPDEELHPCACRPGLDNSEPRRNVAEEKTHASH